MAKINKTKTFSLIKASLAALVASSIFLALPAQAENNDADVPSLKGKRIGITVAGTDHYWDLKAYQGQVDEVKRLGGTPIALDGGRKEAQQIAQIQTLIAQKPDAIIETLGTASVLEPWLKKSARRVFHCLPWTPPAPPVLTLPPLITFILANSWR